MSKDYRILREGEIIREGDEIRSLVGNLWHPALASIGSKAAPQMCRRPRSANLAAAEKRVAELTKALELTVDVMLHYAGWNLNRDKEGKELPMTRPKDVQKAEAIARQALAGRVEG